MSTPKESKEYHKWCHAFLATNTLPLRENFDELTIKLANYIANEVNKEYDRAVIEIGEL